MRSTERTCGHDGGAGAGEAGDAMDAGDLQGFGEAHRRQNSGELSRQHSREVLTLAGWAHFYLLSGGTLSHLASAFTCSR
jgi:hypothetical protein